MRAVFREDPDPARLGPAETGSPVALGMARAVRQRLVAASEDVSGVKARSCHFSGFCPMVPAAVGKGSPPSDPASTGGVTQNRIEATVWIGHPSDVGSRQGLPLPSRRFFVSARQRAGTINATRRHGTDHAHLHGALRHRRGLHRSLQPVRLHGRSNGGGGLGQRRRLHQGLAAGRVLTVGKSEPRLPFGGRGSRRNGGLRDRLRDRRTLGTHRCGALSFRRPAELNTIDP